VAQAVAHGPKQLRIGLAARENSGDAAHACSDVLADLNRASGQSSRRAQPSGLPAALHDVPYFTDAIAIGGGHAGSVCAPIPITKEPIAGAVKQGVLLRSRGAQSLDVNASHAAIERRQPVIIADRDLAAGSRVATVEGWA
jgi:hypothetical protein